MFSPALLSTCLPHRHIVAPFRRTRITEKFSKTCCRRITVHDTSAWPSDFWVGEKRVYTCDLREQKQVCTFTILATYV
ncbi:hypothetical protein POVWA1_013960 [Plasmodium ovale wallikeri]|uniref:Uncharacterized protein n=1 Tax=Plasmodium ovale wallikeri TaxID=864142 RepID=A0A1A8YMT0_PLAOA|nr:hypothetical protein POVWA1_013960 [Plasmodium ovale wallikeri]